MMKTATVVSVLAAFVMLAYGTSCLSFLADIRYMLRLFDVYGLILCGVAVLLSASVGTWSSATIHKSVLRIHYQAIVPAVTALLLAFCILAFADLEASSFDVSIHYKSMSTTLSLETVQLKIQTQLLVTGILCLFVCIFQAATFVAARQLHHLIEQLEIENEEHAILRALREKELGIYGSPSSATVDPSAEDPYFSKYSAKMLGRIYLRNSRGDKDRFVICWATLTGLLDIFVSGTFVVMCFVGVHVKSQWEFAIWRYIGASDARFMNSDSFLICAELFKSVVLGPMLLLFAWATFVIAPYRHVLGIMLCAIHMYNWVIYYMMEAQVGGIDMNGESYAAILALYVFFSFVWSVAVPLYVLVREIRAAVRDTVINDSNKMHSEIGTDGEGSTQHLADIDNIKDKSKQLRRRKQRKGGGRRRRTSSETRGGDEDSHPRPTACMSSETVDILRLFSIESDVEMGVNFESGRFPKPDNGSHPHPLRNTSSQGLLAMQSRGKSGTRDTVSATNSVNDSGTMKSSSSAAGLAREQCDGSMSGTADRALGLDLDSEDVDRVVVFDIATRSSDSDGQVSPSSGSVDRDRDRDRDRERIPWHIHRDRVGSRERRSSAAASVSSDEEKQPPRGDEPGGSGTIRSSPSQASDAGSTDITSAKSLKKKISTSGSVMIV